MVQARRRKLIKGGLPTEAMVAYCWLPNTPGISIISRVVQCNGYASYKTIAIAARDEAITLAFCCAQGARMVILFIAYFLLAG